MFGYATFANAPFASLGAGGAVYDVFVTEAGSSDSSTALAASQLVATNAEAVSTASVVNTINNIFNNLIAEAGSTASVQAAQTNFAALIAETVSAQATQTAIATMLASQSESVIALATPTANSVLLAAILEAASGADENTATKLIVASISEAGSTSGAVAASVVFTGTVAEAAYAIEALTVLRTANVFPTGVQLYVEIGGALVWEVIDDTQNPGWTILPS